MEGWSDRGGSACWNDCACWEWRSVNAKGWSLVGSEAAQDFFGNLGENRV